MVQRINNYYALVAWRIILAYAIFLLSRIIFIGFNFSILEPITTAQLTKIFIGGFKFDTTAILYVNALYVILSFLPATFTVNNIYQKILKILYVTLNFGAISLNLIDTIYFRFSLRRLSMNFFKEFQGDVKLGKILWESLYLYWYIFLIGLLFLALMVYLSGSYKKGMKKGSISGGKPTLLFVVERLVTLVIVLALMVIGVRGGVSRTVRPITLSNANDYVERAIHISAVLNTPFSLIRTIGKDKFEKKNFFNSRKELESQYNPIHNTIPAAKDSLILETIAGVETTGKNVIILIMESFSAENMKFLNPDIEVSYTPFLDSLSKHGVLFTSAYANGRKSIDAIPSILASIPSLFTPFVLTPYATNEIQGLPSLLRKEGYTTAFFHGAPNNSMGIRGISNSTGAEKYYGMNQYPNKDHFDGTWGIWDEHFLQFAATEISNFKEPFLSTIFTLSSHHPFKLPDEYKDQFTVGSIPLHRVIAYSDMALREFFDRVKNEEWFKNTIFVITADHGTIANIYPKYKTSIGLSQIPILYYAPNILKPSVQKMPTQQIDIMPTLLDLLRFDEPYVAFGRSVKSKTTQPFAINFSNNNVQLIRSGNVYQWNLDNYTGIYDVESDTLLNNNLLNRISVDTVKSNNNLNFLRAFLQQYTNRLIDGEMVYKE